MPLYEGYEFFQIEKSNRILVATLNRPEKLNAVRESDHVESAKLLRDVQKDDEVDVLLLRGAGRSFSVGGDLSLVHTTMSGVNSVLRIQKDARDLVEAHLDLDKPVVVAIQGRCSGSGAIMALFSDIIIAEQSALLGDCHTVLGVAAGDGGVLIWPASVGLLRAKKYLLSGDWIDAPTAERYGLVSELVDDGQAWERAAEWAKKLAALEPTGVQLTKRVLNHWYRIGLPAFDAGLAYEMLSFLRPETAERVDALFKPVTKS